MEEKTKLESQEQEHQELIVWDKQGQFSCSQTENDYLSLPWVEQTKNGQIRCVHQILCDYLREHFRLLNTTDALHIYYNGCYVALPEKVWIAMLKNCFPSRYRQERDWKNAYKELRTDTPIPKEMLNANEDIVNFQNGLLNIRTMELLPHTPEYLSTIQLQCNYIFHIRLRLE